MKTPPKSLLVVLAALCLAAAPVFALGKKEAGPNGGRLLTAVDPDVEFFVTKERKIQFTFLDAQNRPTAPDGQSVIVTTGSRQAPTVLRFTRQGDVLLSDAALPAGNNLPAVIQLKPASDAPEVVVKFNINLATCGECSHAEYACTCDH